MEWARDKKASELVEDLKTQKNLDQKIDIAAQRVPFDSKAQQTELEDSDFELEDEDFELDDSDFEELDVVKPSMIALLVVPFVALLIAWLQPSALFAFDFRLSFSCCLFDCN